MWYKDITNNGVKMLLGYIVCTTDKNGVPTYLEQIGQADVSWGPNPQFFKTVTDAIQGLVRLGRALERAENYSRYEDVLESYRFLENAVICPVQVGDKVG